MAVRTVTPTVIILLDGQTIELSRLSDMADYCNPNARGALIKCCLLAGGLVDMECDGAKGGSLANQLEKVLGSGLKLEPWSNLPQVRMSCYSTS